MAIAEDSIQASEFEKLQEALQGFMTRSCWPAQKLKMLNVGTDRPGEFHWRFRLASGEIVVLKMEIER